MRNIFHLLTGFALASIFIILFCGKMVYSQKFPVVHYTKDLELPGNQVLSIFQDNKGYMWFATSMGLVKYNGSDYKIFGRINGLSSNWVFDITESANGDLWIANEFGIDRLKGNDVKSWRLSETEDRFGTYADSYGRVWAYSTVYNGDIFYFKNDSLNNFSDQFNFKHQTVINITEDTEGGVYILTKNGKLYKFFAGKLEQIFIDELKSAIVTYSFFDKTGSLVLCSVKGVAVISKNEIQKSSAQNIIIPKWVLNTQINFGLQSYTGSYWFASNNSGLFRIKKINGDYEKEILNVSEQNGLLSNTILHLTEDFEGNIWIGHPTRGVSKISSLKFSSFGNENGLEANAILTVNELNGLIHCATESGLFKFDGDRFSRIAKDNMISNLPVLCTLKGSSNDILYGTVSGLFRFKSESEIKHIGLKQKVIRSLLRDHNGQIWIGTHEGIMSMNNDDVFVEHDFDVSKESISKLYEVNNRDLYVGTERGLFIIENGTLPYEKKNIIAPDTLSSLSEEINDIISDRHQNMLIATRKGITVFNERKILKEVSNLNGIDVVALFIDSKDNLWAGTSAGLYQLKLQNDVYKVVNRYSQDDGLASNEFTLSGTIYEKPDGSIYFGSFEGLTVYKASEDIIVTAKPRCYINNISVNDSIYMFENISELELSTSQNKIRFLCEGLSFYNEKALKFEYYLHPLEEEWSNVTNNPAITYGYLKPGDYIFNIRVVNQFGIVSDERTLSFTILSPFYLRWWFILLIVLILVYAGYKVNNLRQNHISKRNLLLEMMVNEKTKQLEEKSKGLEESKIQLQEQYEELKIAQNELVEKRELEKAHSEIQLLKDRLTKENIYLREKHGIIQEVSSIIGRSTSIQEVRKKVVEVAPTDSTVLITGATGVGKNLVAEAIHDLSHRNNRALITVNCAAIPDSLVESELFGHEKGSFTGAASKREGKFEVADGSTIFLDEIGDMPLPVQAKLLNVLQSKTFTRVGGNQQINVDVRIITATNHDLIKLVEEGKFRQDLYYRINIYSIHIPPLSERRDDIEPIAKYFIDRFAKMMNKKITAVTKSALNVLENYPYPGNIRELENIIHRAMIISKSETISDEDIIIQSSSEKNKEGQNKNFITKENNFVHLEEMERDYILKVLEHTDGKISGSNGAAEILGLHPNTLRSRMEKLKIVFGNKNVSE